MSQPDIYRYLDYRAWLRDWFEARKAANPRYSHRVFARMAHQRSPSLLLQVVRRQRNLTASTTEAFLGALKLDTEEAGFFRALVQLDQSRTDAERNEAWRRISAARRFREARRLEGGGFRYLSHWYLPAVREMAACPGFRADPAWIARRLRPRIGLAQAREALATLLELGLLREDEDGTVRPAEGSVVTPHEVAGLAAHNYHHGMIERAAGAIEGFAPSERHLCGLTVAIPSAMLPRLKSELDAFQERLLDLCDGSEEPGDRVFQVNLQLFPLSEPLEETP